MNGDTSAADTCPDCGSSVCICGFLREAEARKQMREHSGPLYELAMERSTTAYTAWQKASRPPRITTVWMPVRDADDNVLHGADGEAVYEKRLCLAAALKHGQVVDASPEQLAARAAYWNAVQARRRPSDTPEAL
jgi:hypothetical protein